MNKPTHPPDHDKLFSTPQQRSDFVFDDKVAAVFSDMINRSVPGYATILSMIGVLAARYHQPGTRIYDLGCSLGGASLAMAHQIPHRDFELHAVDNSLAMIQRLETILAEPAHRELPVRVRCEDISDIEIHNASVVVLNFTLQFIAPQRRTELIQRIAAGLQPGGILILSEKILFPDAGLNALFIDLYHEFKQLQGYSALEVSQKRAALENVLIPETIDAHMARLHDAGLHSCDVWFQCFNFCSMVAVR